MPTDDLDRDKLYSADVDDEDVEYELEPPDPDVLAGEERRAEEAIAAATKAINIDEIYRDLDDRRDNEILAEWAKNFRFQFQIKHLLAATAVLAILLTLYQLKMLGTALVLLIMAGVGGATLYLQWQERKRQQEVDRRRQQMYAERRAHFDRQRSHAGTPASPAPAAAPPRPADPIGPTDELEQVRRRVAAAKPYRFRFTLGQFMIAVTCAAVLLGLVNVLGGPQNAATLCGFIALAGLVLHACGYEPRPAIVFVWWVMLLLYVGLTISALIWASFGG